jgi:hypothetical protein
VDRRPAGQGLPAGSGLLCVDDQLHVVSSLAPPRLPSGGRPRWVDRAYREGMKPVLRRDKNHARGSLAASLTSS